MAVTPQWRVVLLTTLEATFTHQQCLKHHHRSQRLACQQDQMGLPPIQQGGVTLQCQEVM